VAVTGAVWVSACAPLSPALLHAVSMSAATPAAKKSPRMMILPQPP
jgi:hypothetical protein